MKKEILHIDEFIKTCGYFTTETTVNNSYGCNHPDQEEQDEDYRTGKQHGKCYAWSCPLANHADLQDVKELNQELYEEWENEEYDLVEVVDYLVIEINERPCPQD